jgi:hypothetical protein
MKDGDNTHFLRDASSLQEKPFFRRRRLSENKHRAAAEWGTSFLEKKASKAPRSIPLGLKYVGDKVVSVVVRDDDGGIHRVIVRRDG